MMMAEIVYSPEMPNYDKRLADIENALKLLAASKNASTENPPPPPIPETWLKKNAAWLTVIGLIFGTGIGGFVTNLFVDSRIDGKLKDDKVFGAILDQHIDPKLKEQRNDFHKLELEVAKLGMKLDLRDHANLKLNDFKRQLPVVAASLDNALKVKASVSDSVIQDIQQKLRNVDQATPGYWPALSRLVNYESQSRSDFLVPQLPECTFYSAPPGAKAVTVDDKKSAKIDHITQSRCTLDLGKLPIYENVTFIDSVIKSSGEPVKLRNVRFENCIFVLSIEKPPTPAGERFGKLLLASDLKDVESGKL